MAATLGHLKKGATKVKVQGIAAVGGEIKLWIDGVEQAVTTVTAGTTEKEITVLALKKGQVVKIRFTPTPAAGATATPETDVEETVPGGKVGAWAGRNWGNVSSVLISIAALGVVIWFTFYVKNQIADIARGMGSGSGMTATGSSDLATFRAELRAELKPVIDRLDATDRALNGWDEPPAPPDPVHTPGLIERFTATEREFAEYKRTHP